MGGPASLPYAALLLSVDSMMCIVQLLLFVVRILNCDIEYFGVCMCVWYHQGYMKNLCNWSLTLSDFLFLPLSLGSKKARTGRHHIVY